MGEQRRRAGSGRPGRHRRTGTALLERREHRRARERRFSLPAPTPSALVGIAVLILIGLGVVHLSSTGSAVPLEQRTHPAAQQEDAGEGDSSDEPESPDAPDSALLGSEAPRDSDDDPDSVEGTGDEPSSPSDSGPLIVHVSGAVGQPGLVRLSAGSRVDDAVLAAGGATEDADLASVNLARPLVDGEQIHIPVPGEDPPQLAAPPPSEDGDGGDLGTGAGPIDLNTASAAQLEELPGVGPAIAQRILDHREKNGAFRSVDDLLEVSGIGPATLEKIREQATVSS